SLWQESHRLESEGGRGSCSVPVKGGGGHSPRAQAARGELWTGSVGLGLESRGQLGGRPRKSERWDAVTGVLRFLSSSVRAWRLPCSWPRRDGSVRHDGRILHQSRHEKKGQFLSHHGAA